jgi:histidine triad (HIT) family protein
MPMKNYQPDCVFCKIIANELPSRKLLDDQSSVAIADLNPQAPTHLLVMPKEHIGNISQCDDADLLGILLRNATKIAKENGLTRGFRLVVNTGVEGGQTVDHLHIHVLGGRAMLWPPG